MGPAGSRWSCGSRAVRAARIEARPSCGLHGQQPSHPHDVVSRGGEGEDPGDERLTSMAKLAYIADCLGPPEALLDQFALALTDRVAGMAGRPGIDTAPPPTRFRVLRDVRRGAQVPQPVHKRVRVVRLVAR